MPGVARVPEASADKSLRVGKAHAFVSGLQTACDTRLCPWDWHVPQAWHHDVRLPDRQKRALVSPRLCFTCSE